MVIPIKPDTAWRGTSDCRNCGIREMALFANLTEDDFGQIHAPIDDLQFPSETALYQEGQKAVGIYTIRSGLIKLVRVTSDGRRRIVRVLRPGDVAGLEALATNRYNSEAIAIYEVSVCRIPLDVVHTLGSSSHRMHIGLMEKWQSALKDADDWLADLNFGSASQRLAGLILKMRWPSDQTIFSLFSRDDMGAMLGLKLETVSREIGKLVRAGVIEPMDKTGRTYRLIQPERLSMT